MRNSIALGLLLNFDSADALKRREWVEIGPQDGFWMEVPDDEPVTTDHPTKASPVSTVKTETSADVVNELRWVEIGPQDGFWMKVPDDKPVTTDHPTKVSPVSTVKTESTQTKKAKAKGISAWFFGSRKW
jgi:hypothetical protein